MQQIVTVLLLAVAGAAILVAFFEVLAVLFPRRVARTHAVASATPGRALLVGAINFAFLGGLVAALLAVSEGARVFAVPALLFAAVLAGAGGLGLAAVVQLVGERLLPGSGAVARTAWGALALGLACALPWIGWFLLLPYAALLGLGAFILGLVQREPRAAPPVPAEAPPAARQL